ncbi:TPA: hypothetical protein NI776_001819 [Pseudomonas aeruginosa]|nr:hypothetical protein [Pseudomonas aeruginosa]
MSNPSTSQPVLHSDEALKFVERIAELSIWSYDKSDGTPYKECEEPSDGYIDSHSCLMDLIEEARKIRAQQAQASSNS